MIINQLNSAAREFYSPNNLKPDHQAYLDKCFDSLSGYLREELPCKYVFSALTFISKSDRKIIGIAASPTSKTGYDFHESYLGILEESVDKLLDDVDAKRCISLTSTLLDDPRFGRDLILQSRDQYAPIQDLRPNTEIFTTAVLEFAEDFEAFLSSKKNLNQIKFFQDLIPAFSDFEITPVGRLLWHYKRLETLCSAESGFYVHFIRPSFIEFDKNILLSLATNCDVDSKSLLLIDLLVYRIASQMAIEKTREADKIEHLKLVSNSIHSIKTGTNILLSPALNSLAEELDDHYLIQIALNARDQLLTITEVTNLITKLVSKQLTNVQKRDELINSKLFSSENDEYLLSDELEKISDLTKMDKTKPRLLLEGHKGIVLRSDFMSFEGVNPSESFYLFLLITAIENCLKHGKLNLRTLTMTLNVEFVSDTKKLTFQNEAKTNEKVEITYENSTGYLNYLFFVFKELNLGEIDCGSDNGTFFLNIRSH